MMPTSPSQSKGRRRFRWIPFLLSIAAVGYLSTAYTSLTVRIRTLDEAIGVIEEFESDFKEGQGAGPCKVAPTAERQDKLFHLLNQVTILDFWISTRWLSIFRIQTPRVEERRRDVFSAMFARALFPSLTCRLSRRMDHIIGTYKNPSEIDLLAPGTERVTAALNTLEKLNKDVSELHRNYSRFVRIAEPGRLSQSRDVAANLKELVKYIYDEPLPPGLLKEDGNSLKALVDEDFDIDWSVFEKRNLDLAEVLRTAIVTASEDKARTLDWGDRKFPDPSPPSLTPLNRVSEMIKLHSWVEDVWIKGVEAQRPCKRIDKARELYFEANVQSSMFFQNGRRAGALLDNEFSLEACESHSKARLSALKMPDGRHAWFIVKHGKDEAAFTVTAQKNAEREFELLESLRRTDLLSASTRRGFECKTPMNGLDAGTLNEANQLAREYLRIASQFDSESWQEDEPERLWADTFVLDRTNGVLDFLMTKSILVSNLEGTTQTALGRVPIRDAQLDRVSHIFSSNLEPVSALLDVYARLGFTESRNEIVRCLQEFSTKALADAELLIDTSQLYSPPLSKGHARRSGASPFYDLGNAVQTAGYLARQRERSKVILSYVRPFLQFLANVGARESVESWQNSVSALEHSIQFKDPESQLANLEAKE